MTPAERMVVDFVHAHPHFEDLFDLHSFAEGVVLPHVFFAMVLDEVVSNYHNPAPAFDTNALFAFLEKCLEGGNPEIVGVITTSFVDDLPWPGQENSGIADELPPLLALEYDRSHTQGLDRT
jgi:hypothetical protein